tara:strand:- start:88 stop:1107 length:1020 start_codon:yes stop_codon:yes gene_type:complete
MKKLLLLLFCLISINNYSQSHFDVIKEWLDWNSLNLWLDTSELEKFEDLHNINLPNLNSGDYSYKGLPDTLSLTLKREAVRIIRSHDMHRKMTKPLGDMALFNINPVYRPKSYIAYPVLFISTAVESFPFVNTYAFREKFGHNYRNRLDYLHCLRDCIEAGIPVYFSKIYDVELLNKYTPEELGIYENEISRNLFEYFIEATAKHVPFILFLFLLLLIYRKDNNHKKYISKFLLFGFINKDIVRENYLWVLSVLFVVLPIFFTFNKGYFRIVSVFQNLKNTDFRVSNNLSGEPMSSMGYENGLYIAWDRAILGYVVVYLIIYTTLTIFYIVSRRKKIVK